MIGRGSVNRKRSVEIRRPGGQPVRWSIALALMVLMSAGCASAEGEDPGEASAPETGAQAASDQQQRRPPPGRAWVIFDADTVLVEIARTPNERAEGLMYREDLPDGTGMIFLFDDSQIRSFWMQNTYIPLDIAYMDAGLSVVDIQAMTPLTTEGYESAAPAMFALEVPQGWFSAHGIGVGSTAELVFGS